MTSTSFNSTALDDAARLEKTRQHFAWQEIVSKRRDLSPPPGSPHGRSRSVAMRKAGGAILPTPTSPRNGGGVDAHRDARCSGA